MSVQEQVAAFIAQHGVTKVPANATGLNDKQIARLYWALDRKA